MRVDRITLAAAIATAFSAPIRHRPLLRRVPPLPLVSHGELFAVWLRVELVGGVGRWRSHLFDIYLHVGLARALNRLIFIKLDRPFGTLRF